MEKIGLDLEYLMQQKSSRNLFILEWWGVKTVKVVKLFSAALQENVAVKGNISIAYLVFSTAALKL